MSKYLYYLQTIIPKNIHNLINIFLLLQIFGKAKTKNIQFLNAKCYSKT